MGSHWKIGNLLQIGRLVLIEHEVDLLKRTYGSGSLYLGSFSTLKNVNPTSMCLSVQVEYVEGSEEFLPLEENSVDCEKH